MFIDTPPLIPKPSSDRRHPTRWEREKAAAGDSSIFENPDDPKSIGPWVLGETIGRGASGRVKIARHRVTKQLAAIKILPVGIVSPGLSPLRAAKHRVSVEREIAMMKLMEHPNIMRLYDVWEGRGNLYLVLEWVKGGELFDLIVERGSLHPAEALVYFKQIIYGLSYCHAFSIAHRDLKPENILIHGSRNELVKIADWGMAAFQTPFTQLETSCGSPHYASPEVIQGERYEGTKADIWSAGVVLFALLAGQLPFDDKDIRSLLFKVKTGVFEMPSCIHPKAADLIRRMLVVDPRKRLCMQDILNHPFLRYDTPGIYYIPAPSFSSLQMPTLSPADIDPDIFSSLRIIFGKHLSVENIQRDLLLDNTNTTKAFYILLLKFRERQLQNCNDNTTKDSRQAGLYPYQASRSRALDCLAIFSGHPDSRNSSRHRPTRTYSLPSPAPSSSLPHNSSTRRPPGVKSHAQVAAIPETAPATSRVLVGIDLNAPAIPSPPLPHDSYPVPPGPSCPTARRGGVAPIDLTTAQLGMAQVQQAHNDATLGRVRMPAAPASSPGLVVTPASLDGVENVPFPMQRVSEVLSSARRPRPCSVGSSENASVLSTRAVKSPCAETTEIITAPCLHDPDVQLVVDDLVNRANMLAVHDNVEHLRRGHPASRPVSVSSDHTSEVRRTHRRSMAEDQTLRTAFQPGKARAKMDFRPSPVRDNKENVPDQPEVPVRRRNSERPRRVPGFFKTPVFSSGNNARRHSVVEENKKAIVKVMARTSTTTGGGIMSKRSIIRKNRPANLDLRAALPSNTTTISFSPVVQEFRGWFSNFFHRKTPTRTLHSPLHYLTTREEMTKLLTELGISFTLEDALGWGVLKCKTDEKLDGSASQKQIRFRVEFQPCRVSIPASPAAGTARHSTPQTVGPPQFVSSMTLIQERGALSAFKDICEKLRLAWRLEALYCPDADTHVLPADQSSHQIAESDSGFLLVRPV